MPQPPTPRAQARPGHIFKHILKKVKYPTPLTPRAQALGVGGVGYLGVFHTFQNVFGNVKSWFSKCQNVQNQVSGFPKGRKMPHKQSTAAARIHQNGLEHKQTQTNAQLGVGYGVCAHLVLIA